jgi:nitric oxide reductase NorE protein
LKGNTIVKVRDIELTANEFTGSLSERDDRPSLPGDFAIWIFIFAEMLAFGVLFITFAFARAGDVEMYNASQQTLNQTAGLINTILLITSSYFVACAVAAISSGNARHCANWLTGAVMLGGCFVAVKIFEFSEKIDSGISLSTNSFYMFYLSLTFFHLMHVLMGMVILGFIIVKARRGGYSRKQHTGVETGASFWHMVDLLWIILFPLVYIMH